VSVGPAASGGGDAVEIDERAFLSDTSTGALIATDATIDWWSPGRFDAAPTCFRLLDPRGGALRVGIAGLSASAPSSNQTYLGDGLTVETVLRHGDVAIRVLDTMPWDGSASSGAGTVMRLVEAARGPVDIVIEVVPGSAFAMARDVDVWAHGARFDATVVHTGTPMSVEPAVLRPGRRETTPVLRGYWRLRAGEAVAVVAGPAGCEPASPDRVRAAVERTLAAWQRVAAPGEFDGVWQRLTLRSALVLRALTGSGGGFVEAPTTSLPIVEGGERSSDDRYVRTADVARWAVAAQQLGLAEESALAVAWLEAALDSNMPIPCLSAVDGEPPPSEHVVPGLAGWRGSEPVVAGSNDDELPSVEASAALLSALGTLCSSGASSQESDRVGAPLLGRWDRVVELADWLDEHAASRPEGLRREPGPWRLRGSSAASVGGLLVVRHAMESVRRVALARNPLDLDAVGWHRARQSLDRRLNSERTSQGALHATAGLDPEASLLRMAWLGPWPPGEPIVAATVARIVERLRVGPWLYPYPPESDDGWPGAPAASVVATLWLARALARLGQIEEASLVLESVAALAGVRGLLPAWVDPVTGRARGNYPSAAAHLAWIEAVLSLRAGRHM
jgi:hypothetical protein